MCLNETMIQKCPQRCYGWLLFCFSEIVDNAWVNATCGDSLFGRNKNVCIVLCCDRACGLSVGGMGGPDRQETGGLTVKLSG